MSLVKAFTAHFEKVIKNKATLDAKFGCCEDDITFKEELGKGAYGRVYKIRAKNGKVWVLKRILLEESREKLSDLLKEVKLLQSFKHPHIVKYYHSFVSDCYLNILMEYAVGGDMHKLLEKQSKSKTRFSEAKLWKWAYELLLAVDYLHNNKSVIHCDIKTSNVFLTKNKRVKLGDFGGSKILNPAKMYLSDTVGTTLYLSPEQVNNKIVYDFKVDIWAIGWCLYYLATFKPPFSGATFESLSYSILNDEPESIRPYGYSEDFQSFLQKAMTKLLKDRPNAMELCLMIPNSTVKSYIAPKSIHATSTSFMNPTKSTASRQKPACKSKSSNLVQGSEKSVKLIKIRRLKNKIRKVPIPHSNYEKESTEASTIMPPLETPSKVLITRSCYKTHQSSFHKPKVGRFNLEESKYSNDYLKQRKERDSLPPAHRFDNRKFSLNPKSDFERDNSVRYYRVTRDSGLNSMMKGCSKLVLSVKHQPKEY